MSLTANWSYPTLIRFGAGRIVEIAEACQVIGIKKRLWRIATSAFIPSVFTA